MSNQIQPNVPLEEETDSLMAESRWQDVLALVEGLPAEEIRSHRVLWNIGWACFQLDRYGSAESYLRCAIALSPADHASHGALGATLFKLGNPVEAELCLLRSLAIRDASISRLVLAALYTEQGHDEQAEAIYKEGVRLQPEQRGRLEAYGDFLSDQGREAEANELYEQASRLAPPP